MATRIQLATAKCTALYLGLPEYRGPLIGDLTLSLVEHDASACGKSGARAGELRAVRTVFQDSSPWMECLILQVDPPSSASSALVVAAAVFLRDDAIAFVPPDMTWTVGGDIASAQNGPHSQALCESVLDNRKRVIAAIESANRPGVVLSTGLKAPQFDEPGSFMFTETTTGGGHQQIPLTYSFMQSDPPMSSVTWSIRDGSVKGAWGNGREFNVKYEPTFGAATTIHIVAGTSNAFAELEKDGAAARFFKLYKEAFGHRNIGRIDENDEWSNFIRGEWGFLVRQLPNGAPAVILEVPSQVPLQLWQKYPSRSGIQKLLGSKANDANLVHHRPGTPIPR